jgi:phosphate transport system substrate-binding protein
MGAASLAGCVEFRSARTSRSELTGTIDVRGSSTVYPLMNAFAEEFAETHDGVVINNTSTGTGAGFGDFFCEGSSDFNNASRPMREPEAQQCQSNGVEYVRLTLATDAITVIVNNDADFVDCLTIEELAQIWREDGADRWSDVRDEFPDESIQRFGAADTSGTYDYFISNVIGEEGQHTTDYQATEDDNSILAGVEGDRYAIGYLGFSYYYSNPDTVKALALNNGDGCVEPSLETASSGAYETLSRPLMTYVAKSALRKDHVVEFARYALQRSVDESLVAGDVGYVPNSPERMGVQLAKLNRIVREVQE